MADLPLEHPQALDPTRMYRCARPPLIGGETEVPGADLFDRVLSRNSDYRVIDPPCFVPLLSVLTDLGRIAWVDINHAPEMIDRDGWVVLHPQTAAIVPYGRWLHSPSTLQAWTIFWHERPAESLAAQSVPENVQGRLTEEISETPTRPRRPSPWTKAKDVSSDD